MAKNDVTFDMFFKNDLVFHDVDWVDTADFFHKISENLERGGYVAPTFYGAITERELNYPTGLQTASIGAAIPHADPVHIKEPFIAVIRPTHSIAFAPMGGSPDDEKIQAKIIFVLGVMRNGLQVKVLQRLMGMLSDEAVIHQLLQASNEDEILRIIKNSFTSEQTV
ncbi:PTS sugar transporter subunit IIA [Sporolactobacillus laevolacticus]|uniref:PTS sugar transporter subunit IIA n=1 Tax=Sporolactobacillus laevolacticus TaxID=33018 RepID=UPI0025B5072B|nr:PTS sugar transporter subunit IIA [Sporolactobacillus laevolacticus]MDN3954795.1 PTS sugar transporter subunit IIA [Sporolactobacillus laevolacticus]